jgi:glucose-1-phosphatase
MGHRQVEVVLFDMGGVLVELGGDDRLLHWAGIADVEESWRRWLTCRWVRSFERGNCSPSEFAAGFVSDWSLPLSPEQFLHEFLGWLVGPLAGAEDLVALTRQSVPVALLSNTNTLHWQAACSWPLFGLFDSRFLSHETGLVKPDPEAFEHVCQELKVDPVAVLFLDDNLLNVNAAIEVGLLAVRVKGIDEAKQALVAAGVVAN